MNRKSKKREIAPKIQDQFRPAAHQAKKRIKKNSQRQKEGKKKP